MLWFLDVSTAVRHQLYLLWHDPNVGTYAYRGWESQHQNTVWEFWGTYAPCFVLYFEGIGRHRDEYSFGETNMFVQSVREGDWMRSMVGLSSPTKDLQEEGEAENRPGS